MTTAQLIANTNPMKYEFVGIAVPNFNGNVPGSPNNMGVPEIEWILVLWREARLDRWIPAPTQVGVTFVEFLSLASVSCLRVSPH